MTLEIAGPALPAGRRFDREQLAAYLDDIEDFCSSHRIPVPRTLDGILALPGILVDAPVSGDAVAATWPLVERALAEALAGLDGMRRAEGAALERDMREGCRGIGEIVGAIRERLPAVLREHHARLEERVRRLLESSGTQLSPADLAREVAVIADRSDVAEELVRLESHVAQFERLLDEESPGRQLEFLSQELAREANTVAAKSTDVSIAHTVVEIKTRVERLREQVQNLE